MGPLAIDPSKTGAWRVEEEFVNAVRGREGVTHTDLVTAAKYMEWTDAVTLSMRERREGRLPLFCDLGRPEFSGVGRPRAWARSVVALVLVSSAHWR